MKKFLLGETYSEITPELYDKKIKEATSYEINKNTYLNEFYDNVKSKKALWFMYVNNILFYEKSLNKDLYEFNMEELRNLLSSQASNSENVRSQIFVFCEQYIDWNIDKGRVSINQMNGLNREELTKVGKKSAQKQIIGLKDFYDTMKIIETKTDLQHAMVYILARYGLQGEELNEIINFKLSDIDRENMLICVYNEDGEVIKQLPVDENFVNWCDKTYEDDTNGVSQNNDYVKYEDYLLKETLRSEGSGTIKTATIYNRVNTVEKTTGIRFKINNLNKSRKIELLLERRKERLLTTGDFDEITKMFNPTATIGAYATLVKYYKNISGDDEVIGRNKLNKVSLEDQNSEEFVEKLKKELNF